MLKNDENYETKSKSFTEQLVYAMLSPLQDHT